MAKSAKTTAREKLPEDEEEPLAGTLARGLSVLRVVLAAPQPLTLKEIAALTQLDQTTTLRLLRTLETREHVIRARDGKRYLPSPRAVAPLPLMHPLREVRREAMPILNRLAAAFGATIVFVLYIEHERIVVEVVRSPLSVTPYYSSWLVGPLHATGTGKALLLSLSEDERRSLLGSEPFIAATPSSLTTHAALAKDLEESAQRGFTVTKDEHQMGISAIAANIPDQEGRPIGCLCVTCYSRDLDPAKISAIGQELRTAAQLMPYQVVSLRSAVHYLGRP